MPTLRIGIDIGGTFTDFVIHDPESQSLETFKLLSTPRDPSEVVLNGLQLIRARYADHPKGMEIIHGSTVATNALLERKGAREALVTTRGFADVLQIARQNRPEIYDLTPAPLPPLVPHRLRMEVAERVDCKGNVVQPLAKEEVVTLVEKIKTSGVHSAAVCLLFSFLHPEHEALIGEQLRAAGIVTSLSSEILPEFREYERTSTTVVNAYVSPVMERYLARLELAFSNGKAVGKHGKRGAPTVLRVMQSNGGSISPGVARREAVRCILSGPAGGVVGCEYAGRSAFDASGTQAADGLKLITFDMGGTSTDVSLIDEHPQITTEAVINGCPIRLPMLDIHTIGAGGGSIARRDAGGALRVGPESAGADPGPACYGRIRKGVAVPTVTDANVLLGRIPADHFLGGEMALDIEQALQSVENLGRELGISTEQAALGMIAVVNAHMERALRVISVERGHDPRLFTLLSFGGAGGLHAADLARGLGIPRVLIPPLAATLSAFGMLCADVVKDYSQTVMLPGTTSQAKLASLLEPMLRQGKKALRSEGVPSADIIAERFLDIRYQGQSYELMVPFADDPCKEFHSLHRARFGYAQSDAPVELVNLRVRLTGKTTPPNLSRQSSRVTDPSSAFLELRPVLFPEGRLETPLYKGESLRFGNRLQGPAVIVRSDTTILLSPADQAEVDAYGNLWVEVGA